MKDYTVEDKGKQLAWLLRHDSHSFVKGLIDENGWRNVKEIIEKYHYTQRLLDEIVETNNKQRYEYNDDKTKIRARQGHSINVNVDLKLTAPPDTLYHGTATRFLSSIKSCGIVSGTRLYVHLSDNVDTAINVGKRHGTPCVIEIDAKKMHDDGIEFYLSNNNVWLTKEVPVKYFKNVIYN